VREQQEPELIALDQRNLSAEEFHDQDAHRQDDRQNEGDDALDKGMMQLFTSNTNAVEIIKKKDLYQMLEIVTDKCEDAANVIESIIIKYV